MTVPYTFANQTGSIPLSELDANFSNVSNYSSFAGTVVSNAQPNITSVGTLVSLSATGNITGSYFLGNGSQLTGLSATYGNANVVANLAALGTNPISTTGNISANYYVGNGSLLTGIGVSSYGNANVAANLAALGSNPISTTGNITGGNVLFGSGVVSGTGNVSGNVGTFTTHNGTTFSASGNITGGNVLFGSGVVSGTGNISGNLITATTLNATTISASGNVTGGNVLFGTGIVSGTGNILGNVVTATILNATTISASGNVTGGNLSVGTGIVSIGSLVNNNSNGVGDIGSSSLYFNTVFAKATSAQYADLAENYLADAPYVSGTVVSIGGDAEVTQSSVDADGTVIGVVSTNPAYHMNAGLAGGYVVAVALTGRVPCRVTGSVKRGSAMVSNGDGTARADESPAAGTIIGKALTSFNGNTGVIEVVVGRF
jgi:hypothetical protein